MSTPPRKRTETLRAKKEIKSSTNSQLKRKDRKDTLQKELETILNPTNQRQQLDSLIALCRRSIEYLRETEGEMSVGSEEELRVLDEDPERMKLWPSRQSTDEAKQSDLDELETVLKELPGHIGTLLIGSFGTDYKRDPFSDLDVNCICSEVPTRAQQASILQRLQGVSEPFPGFGCFLPLGLSATVVHMSFVSQANQDALFRMRTDQGTEFPLIEISNERFAAGSYYWSTGKIVSDRDGSLQSYQRQANEIPKKYRESLTASFKHPWDRHRIMFLESREHDRVATLTALNLCTVAVLRALLLKHDIHTDPMSPPKWLPIEIENLPTSRVESMEGSELVPKDPLVAWSERFKDLERLWGIVSAN